MKTIAASPARFGLIVGAMKCGTTSLFNYLASHPEVAPCRIKEPNYFSSDEFRPNDVQNYFSLWDWDPHKHRIAVEASVNYSKIPTKPNCAERIAQLAGLDFRFIYCMRNPLDRIESHVYHGLYAGWTNPLESGISEHAINVSRYATQLDAFVKEFGRNRILLIVSEKLQKNPAEEFRRVCEFLEIDPKIPLKRHRSHNRSSDHYVENPLWGRIRGVESFRKAAHLIPLEVRKAVLRLTGRRLPIRRELTCFERDQILEALDSDLRRLKSDYGIDSRELWGITL